MRVYKFFLRETYENIKSINISLYMNFKYIYIDDNNCIILYAWTTKKRIRDEFIKNRSKCFIYSKADIPDDMFHKFEIDYKESKLIYRVFNHYDDINKRITEVACLCTIDESVVIEESSEEILGEIVYKYTNSDPSILKDEFKNSLDIILYTLYRGLYNSEDDDEEEFVEYNRSFGLTPMGNKMDLSIDELNLFISIFGKFFKKG